MQQKDKPAMLHNKTKASAVAVQLPIEHGYIH